MVPEAETSDFEELGGMSVERLTVWRKDGRASIANRDGATPLQQTMKITDVIDRLAAIEDILGDEYDLDRLRELAQADREGRCVVMPCQPGDKISYKSGAGLLCNAVIDEYTPKNIFITAKTEIPNAEPLSQTFSISEVEAALRREQDG